MDADATERRDFAVPPRSGVVDGVDLSLLDPADPDQRRLLIEAEHPEEAAALDAGVDELTGEGGEPYSPALHVLMHEVVANQLWDNDPPEVWETAIRLRDAGYERHEILHMLSRCNAGEVWHMRFHRQPFDLDRFRACLEALPESWEDEREEKLRAQRRRGRRDPLGDHLGPPSSAP